MGFTSTACSTTAAAPAGDFISYNAAGTLWGLFCERVHRTPDSVAYRQYHGGTGSWRDHTWRDVDTRTNQFRAALAAEELRPGDRVAVVLPNGVDWVCFDLAAHALGLVVVALYPHDTAASNAYILGHSLGCCWPILLPVGNHSWLSVPSSRRWSAYGFVRGMPNQWWRAFQSDPAVAPPMFSLLAVGRRHIPARRRRWRR